MRTTSKWLRGREVFALTFGTFLCFTSTADTNSPPVAVVFRGAISNSFFVEGQLLEKGREFEVAVTERGSSYIVRDAERRTESRASFINGEYSYTLQGPFTNRSGQVSNVVSARIETRRHPRDDGSWINYLWLGFGSYDYFAHRTNSAAHPIWATGLREKNENKLGTTAVFWPLETAHYPASVCYVTDGNVYFEVKESNSLQKKQMRPPFDSGFTNLAFNLISTTNLDGEQVPVEFEISRFGTQNTWQTNASLKLLMISHVWVYSVNRQTNRVSEPGFAGRVVALDARISPDGTGLRGLHVAMTNGNWPNISETRRIYESQKRAIEINKAQTKDLGPRRKLVLAAFLLSSIGFAVLLIWNHRSRPTVL